MMLLVCSVVIATGVWSCSEPMPFNEAVALVVAANEVLGWKVGDSHSPQTLFNPNQNPARSKLEGKK
jgi:hypothetical protein